MAPRTPRGRSRSRARAPRRAASAPAAPSRGWGAAASLPGGIVLGLILLGGAILHWDAIRLPFFADDYLFLEQARGRALPAVLAAPDVIGNFFRPVGRQLYFWILAHPFGESPAAAHAANLVLFLGVVALLFVVVRRLAGLGAAAVGAGFLALHYAADVPLRWVSGSQDLLAVLGALAAIALHLAGRRAWAAPALLLALLSKETVLLTPLIAAAADRRPGERWPVALRRAWPLGLAVAVWAALWLVTLPQRRGLGASLGLEATGAVAILVHLVPVILGLEWRGALGAMGRAVPPLLALAPILVAVFGAGGRVDRGVRALVVTGGVWVAAAAAPLVAVASVWSAYYFLFALCGAGLVVGALAARGPLWVRLLVVTVLAAGSQSGRSSPEFAGGRGAWTMQSHINRRYVDRATDGIGRHLADLKRQRPTVPPRSTFFFAGIPAFMAWQAGDGPLVRWAYRDTSLRSYYQSDFTLARAQRGPAFFFAREGDTLREELREPDQLRLIALRVTLNDRYDTGRDLLLWLDQQRPSTVDVLYFLAWLEWANGDTLAALGHLERAGIAPGRDAAREVARAQELAAAGRVPDAIAVLSGAIPQNGLDPRLHGMLAELMMGRDPGEPQGWIEALATRALTPEDGRAWVMWGAIQAAAGRHSQAVRSLERAQTLGIPDPARAIQVRQMLTELRRMVPGGDLAQQELRGGAGKR